MLLLDELIVDFYLFDSLLRCTSVAPGGADSVAHQAGRQAGPEAPLHH